MPIEIAVLVKQVPDHEASVRLDQDGALEIEDRYVCSFFDEIAVEAALKLREAHPDARLVALSAGGRRAVDALRRAVAMGIDEAERIGDESLDEADSLRVAAALAARLRARSPGLVLCGKQAGDDDMGAVGPMVAALLGAGHACAAVSLEVDPAAGSALVGRKVEGGIWSVRAPLPVVVSVEKGLAEPHIPVVTRVMKAMRSEIPNVPLADLGSGPAADGGRTRRIGYAPPPTRPPVTMLDQPFPENVEDLVRRLQQAGAVG